ncbi:MAG: sulfatase [Myxococcota bacterium]
MRALASCLLAAAACAPSVPDDRPSFLLVVLDTLRADAVSAYGSVDGTTPHIDALAAEGLRYERAFAPAPWTLPSHATLFTGVEPEQHGVGIAGRMVLPEGPPTLAERLGAAGYETVGFSENPLVAAQFGMARGFDHFEGELGVSMYRARGRPDSIFDVVLGVSAWADQRDARRPFLVFVNLFGVHDPYEIEEDHLFLPPGVGVERAALVRTGGPSKGIAEVAGICDRLPTREELAIVRALYLGGVAAADATLAAIQRALEKAAGDAPLVTIVTSDHGEHLGENRLLGHEFSLHNEVLRVPLVVHGLPGVTPATISTPVGLGDIAPSILAWAGIETRATLPVAATAAGAGDRGRALVSVFSDAGWVPPEGGSSKHGEVMIRRRRGCGPADRVFGDMASIIDFPWKLIWYRNNSPQLFDLSWDRRERSNVAEHHPEIVTRLTNELAPLRAQMAQQGDASPLEPTASETLRALGYIE